MRSRQRQILSARLERISKSWGLTQRRIKAPWSSKDTIQALHLEQWNAILKEQRQIPPEALPRLKKYFSSDDEVDRREKLHNLVSITPKRAGRLSRARHT